VELLDRAGLVYALEGDPAGAELPGAAGTTVVLTGVATDRARLGALARAVAPDHRRVVPEPLRFLYLGRAHVGQRWYVTGIDGEIEPATFGDGLYAAEQLTIGAREQWGAPPLLVGHGQGGTLALALALLVPERLAGVVALDAALPEVPGWERPPTALEGLPVMLLAGDQPTAAVQRTRQELLRAGARLTATPPSTEPTVLDPALDAVIADWWRDVAPGRPSTS
jgi:pimeloyl-ACP methyl ester carboxylesterase